MGRTLESSMESREALRRTLAEVRRGLLGLHKALIVAEQLTYERINGRVGSTGQLLQLVLNDPWFTWLHPLSQLVIRVDELLDEGEELTTVEVEHLDRKSTRLNSSHLVISYAVLCLKKQ